MVNHTVKMHGKHVYLPKSAVTVILTAVGPRLGGEIVSQVNFWIQTNGIEWTVQRLKNLRTAAINLKSASKAPSRRDKNLRGHKVAQGIYQANSIAYRRDTLIPRGCFGRIVQGYVDAKKPLTIRRFALVLRLYTALVLPELSEKQYNKAKQSINHTTERKEEYFLAQSCVVNGWIYLREHLPKHLFEENGTLKIGKPDLRRLNPFTSLHVSPNLKGWENLKSIPYGKWAASFASVCAWPPQFRSDPEGLGPEYDDPTEGVYPYDVWAFIRSHSFNPSADGCVGRIEFLQEPGAKARVVAIPNAALQWGFEPLHKALDTLLQYVPWSCIHDQNTGAEYLRKILGHREVAGCIDLSDATNNFPRSLQTALLTEMGLRKWGEALDWVSTGDWCVNTKIHGEETWSYGTGQPMGLYGSFPLFSLTYICMMIGAYFYLRDVKTTRGEAFTLTLTDAFRDLGDDIIVKSKSLTSFLEKLLNAIGCPVAAEKSVVSKSFGEFAGFEAHVTNQCVTTFRPYKFGSSRRNCFVRSGVSLIHSLGKRVSYLGKYWSDKYRRYELTKDFRFPDLSPMFHLGDRQEVHLNYLDVPRLTQLLQTADQFMTGIKFSDEEFGLWQLELLSEVLLSEEQATEEEPRPILEYKEVEPPRKPFEAGGNISNDPFLGKEGDVLLDLLEIKVDHVEQVPNKIVGLEPLRFDDEKVMLPQELIGK